MRTFRDAIDAHAAARAGRAVPARAGTGRGRSPTRAARAAARALAACFARRRASRPATVVSFMLPNGIAAASVFLGAMYGGYVVSPVNLLAQDSQLAYTLAHSGTRIVFAAPEFVDRLHALVDAHADVVPRDRRPTSTRPARRCRTRGGSPRCPLDAEAPAMLMYTSGTTGVPKGALLSHANMVHAGRAVARRARADARRPRAVVAAALPHQRPVHRHGRAARVGRQHRDAASLQRVAMVAAGRDATGRRGSTWSRRSSRICSTVRDLTPAQAAACRGVRFGRSASAPLPPEQHRAFEARFGISVIEAMGLTECASVAFANPLDPRRRKFGSPGLPLGVEARVVARGRRGARRPASAGEIELRGDNVMLGYYKDARGDRAALAPDGWLAHRRPRLSRRRRLLLHHRPAEGADHQGRREHRAARDRRGAAEASARCSRPRRSASPIRDYGQEILACVVLKPGARAREDELRAHCLRELGRYKTPEAFRFVAELPKGPSGKVQRLKLAADEG